MREKLFLSLIISCALVTSQNLLAGQAQDLNESFQALQQLQQLTQSQKAAQAEQSANAQNSANQQSLDSGQPQSLATQQTPGTAAPTLASPATPSGQTIQMQSASVDTEEAIDEAAFRATLKETFPLSPEQIVRLRKAYNATRLAESTEAATPPKPIATSQLVNLAPGSTPPVIRLSQGFVSSLVFLDSTGAPWPIAAYDLGNPQAFNIQWDKTSNTLMIQASKVYTYGNLAVRLHNLNTPVMLTLIPGQKAVDYRVDLRIQGLGPNAKAMPTGEGLPPGATPLLLKILDGVAPPGARLVTVSGGEAQGWIHGEKLFLRTRLTILSPGWIATMESADGMRAYEMNKTPVLLVSERGKIVQLKVEGL